MLCYSGMISHSVITKQAGSTEWGVCKLDTIIPSKERPHATGNEPDVRGRPHAPWKRAPGSGRSGSWYTHWTHTLWNPELDSAT